MKVFIYEHLCAAGYADIAGSESMLAEGEAMLGAALRDFERVEGVKPFSIVDPIKGAWLDSFTDHVQKCDAALIIAPESGGILSELTEVVSKLGKINLGSSVNAISVTGDKLEFSNVMRKAGINHPQTVLIDNNYDAARHFDGSWVVKPIDGAGSERVDVYMKGVYEQGRAEAGMIAQEYVEGAPMSLCVVSDENSSLILSVNRQRISCDMRYEGGEILDVCPDDALRSLIDDVKKAIPGLEGYWGLDYIDRGKYFDPVAIEVNPRLTTSYSALSEALDVNPAQIILNSANGASLPEITSRKVIRFGVSGVAKSS